MPHGSDLIDYAGSMSAQGTRCHPVSEANQRYTRRLESFIETDQNYAIRQDDIQGHRQISPVWGETADTAEQKAMPEWGPRGIRLCHVGQAASPGGSHEHAVLRILGILVFDKWYSGTRRPLQLLHTALRGCRMLLDYFYAHVSMYMYPRTTARRTGSLSKWHTNRDNIRMSICPVWGNCCWQYWMLFGGPKLGTSGFMGHEMCGLDYSLVKATLLRLKNRRHLKFKWILSRWEIDARQPLM